VFVPPAADGCASTGSGGGGGGCDSGASSPEAATQQSASAGAGGPPASAPGAEGARGGDDATLAAAGQLRAELAAAREQLQAQAGEIERLRRGQVVTALPQLGAEPGSDEDDPLHLQQSLMEALQAQVGGLAGQG
jgi:hypothetical protein